MPRTSQDKLVLLINSLNKSEKRSFRLFVNRNPSASNSLFMKLFDIIIKEKTYDEAVALKRIAGLKKSQLSNLRANLYKQILSCLRLLDRNKIEEIQVREQMDHAKILYEKGLYKPCLELLEKAKKQALSINYETLALSIIYFEKKIESQHVTGSMSAKADELSLQSENLLKDIYLTNKLSNASLLLYGRYLRHGYVKNKEEFEDLKSFFENLVPDCDLKSLEFYQKLYYFQSYVWYYHMSQDFANYFKYAQKWVDMYNEDPLKKNTITTPYLKGMHNLLNAFFMAQKRPRFNKAYESLLEYDIMAKPNVSRNEVSLYYLFKWTHYLNRLFINAEYHETSELKEFRQLMEENPYSWDLNRMMVFNYKLGSVYFGIGDLDTASFYLTKITNNHYQEFKEDLQSFARILNLITNFDSGNESLVSYQVKSLYRYLSNRKELQQMQMEIIKFLRRTTKMYPDRMKDEFYALKVKLEKIAIRPYEQRPFLYLDIISWLESKIQEKSMREVLIEKLEA